MTDPTPRATLAANLRQMIAAATPKGAKPSVRAWAIGKGLDLAHGVELAEADRARLMRCAGRIAYLHLLFDGLDPANPPSDPITDEERAMLKRLRRLLDT